MKGKRLAGVLLAAALMISWNTTAFAAEKYNDIEQITSHVKFKVPSTLAISRPTGEISTNDAGYFITGSSDPDQKLTMNGEVVTTRGRRGSFGVFVTLDAKENVFTFKQGSKSERVIIRKGAPAADKISDVRRMAPDYNFAVASGESALLSCEAPSGATVSASIGGKTVRLSQKAATAQEGVAARFEAVFTPGTVSKTTDLGSVTYTVSYNGKTFSKQSQGRLFAAGDKLVVQVQNNAASIYNTEKHEAYLGEGRLGAVDYVTDIGTSDYKLASGGYVPHSSVTPVAGNVAVKNKVSDASYQLIDGGERLLLTGTSHPLYRASQTESALTIRLLNTTGVKNVMPDLSDSKLFETVRVTEEDSTTTLTFTLTKGQSLWGYDVSYKNGVTTIYAKHSPKLKTGSKPLAGVKVVLDPGHGGDDPGAIGMAGLGGSVESDINYMTAVAAQKRLESLGATVVLTRGENETLDLNQRMEITQRERADFFLAIHSNSIGFGSSSINAKGVESYYYDDISKKFATLVTNQVASYNGRSNRGTKRSNYRVTMNSFCPSALVELGFVTNPEDYDNLTTKNAVFQTANAIGDAVIAALS